VSGLGEVIIKRQDAHSSRLKYSPEIEWSLIFKKLSNRSRLHMGHLVIEIICKCIVMVLKLNRRQDFYLNNGPYFNKVILPFLAYSLFS